MKKILVTKIIRESFFAYDQFDPIDCMKAISLEQPEYTYPKTEYEMQLEAEQFPGGVCPKDTILLKYPSDIISIEIVTDNE